MRRNMAASLIEHETISTTLEKAKEVKPFVEKLITLSKKATLQNRRRAISLLGNRDIFGEEDGEPVRKGTVIGKLFSELGPRYLDRPGGYSRIIRLPMRRLGDNGTLVLLQLLGEDEPLKKDKKARTKRSAARKAKAEKEAEAKAQAEEEAVADDAEQTSTEAAVGEDEVSGRVEQSEQAADGQQDGEAPEDVSEESDQEQAGGSDAADDDTK